MDFILGIFTGISIAILWGMYLNKQREKQKEREAKIAIEGINSLFNLFGGMASVAGKSLEKQLQDAIARDDFEEAARLRDLLNTKK